jgi:hypothetical protein
MSEVVEDFEGKVVAVRSLAEAHELMVFDGLATGSGHEVWGECDWREFVAFGGKVGAKVLYMHVSTYSLDSLVDRLLEDSIISDWFAASGDAADEAENDGGDDGARSAATKIVELIMGLAPNLVAKEGDAVALFLAWAHSGVLHKLYLRSSISDLVDDVEEQVRIHVEQQSARSQADRVASNDKRYDLLANALVAHPRWPEATNGDKRLFLARKMFPDVRRHELQEIIALAQTVAWWKAGDVGENNLVERVRELLTLGRSKYAISALLNLPEAQIADLIAVCDASRESETGGPR